MKCCIALNNASGFSFNPDAIGWRFTYGNLNKEGSFIVECKTSRADFKKDESTLFRINPELGCGNWRYFLVQENLVQPHEIPDKWGLIYVNEKGKCKLIYNSHQVLHDKHVEILKQIDDAYQEVFRRVAAVEKLYLERFKESRGESKK